MANHWLTPVAGYALTADRYPQPVDCRFGAMVCSFQFKGVETGTPIVKFKFQGSDDPRVENDLYVNGPAGTPLYGTSSETATWTPITLPSTAVIHGTGFTAPTLPATLIDWDGSAALNMAIVFTPTFKRIRCFVDWQSGGGASAILTVWGGSEME